MSSATAFEGWAVLELLGHRVRYGRVSEVTLFGESFARVEVPSEPPTVEYYSGKSIYGIRPVPEETIRAYHRPRPALSSGEVLVDDDDWDDDDAVIRPRHPAMDPINPELGMDALDETGGDP